MTAAVLALLATRRLGSRGLLAAAGGGVAFGVASAATQTLSVQFTDVGLAVLTTPAAVLAVLAVAGLDVAGVWFIQLSYCHGLAAPLAVSTVANPVVAAAIGIVLLGEQLRGGAAGMALTAVCALPASPQLSDGSLSRSSTVRIRSGRARPRAWR